MRHVQSQIAQFTILGLQYPFTPTALYLEAEPETTQQAINGLKLSKDQVREALAHLSPAAKFIAVALARTEEERQQIADLPVEVGSKPVENEHFEQVERNLKEVPPVAFDLARQVRVYATYLQYVEVELRGAAIQKKTVSIPKSILALGSDAKTVKRMRTTFKVIDEDDDLSSKSLDRELEEIRRAFTVSLPRYGRVLLKRNKAAFQERIKEFEQKLAAYQKKLENDLRARLEALRARVIDYYLPMVQKNPPAELTGGIFSSDLTEDHCRRWLEHKLNGVLPKPERLIGKMKLTVDYKDVTYETLNDADFLKAMREAFPYENWDKVHEEFQAAGQLEGKQTGDRGRA